MKILEDLNQEQKEAVVYKEGPILIVAGAGTGKTTVITRRIAHLIDSKECKSDEILALTFTDKAAGEMEERVDKLLPYGYLDLWISTFHSFGERILKDHALEIGLPNDFKLLNQTEQWLLIRENLDAFDLDYYKPLGNPTKFIQALVRHFSRAKDEEISPLEYINYVENLKLNSDSKEIVEGEIQKLAEVAYGYKTYQDLLLKNNSLDFGDLINYTLKLFRARQNILNKYREQFKYILVDEFQDTNWAQYELIKLLAAPKNNITVVFDDDQSIYRWRGASVSNVLQFKKDYPESKEIVLLENYRSFQNILDLSYKSIQFNNPNRLEHLKKIDKKLKSVNKGDALIEHLHAKTSVGEVKLVIDKILELKEKDKETLWSDFAILVRANSQAENFIQGLYKAGIPHTFLASRGLYKKAVILDILAYLKLLDNYHESPPLFRVLSLPLFKFTSEDLVNLNYLAQRKSWSLYEALKQARAYPQYVSEAVVKEIDKVLALIQKHSTELRAKTPGEIIYSFLQDSGYLKHLSDRVLKNQDIKAQEDIEYITKFFKKVEEYELNSQSPKVSEFIELIDMEIEGGEEGALSPSIEEGPDSIKVMTIHSAKGLEFKYVFIVNLVDQRFPTRERKEAIELRDALAKEVLPEGDIHLQEERRLFYVACTRAKEGLFFTSAEDYGGMRKKRLSRFLEEAGFFGGERSQAQVGRREGAMLLFYLTNSPSLNTKRT